MVIDYVLILNRSLPHFFWLYVAFAVVANLVYLGSSIYACVLAAKGRFHYFWYSDAGPTRATTARTRLPSQPARLPKIFRRRVFDVRILRELLLLLSLYAGIGLGVYGVWRLWPESKTKRRARRRTDTSLLDRTEGKLRGLLRQEVTADANDEPVVKEGLRKLQERLNPALGKLSFPLEVYVIDSGTVNAVCLPGNIILVYSGLLRRLQSPEELAAILAHETAHAMHRDPMQALKRELGLAALFAMVGGAGMASPDA